MSVPIVNMKTLQDFVSHLLISSNGISYISGILFDSAEYPHESGAPFRIMNMLYVKCTIKKGNRGKRSVRVLCFNS